MIKIEIVGNSLMDCLSQIGDIPGYAPTKSETAETIVVPAVNEIPVAEPVTAEPAKPKKPKKTPVDEPTPEQVAETAKETASKALEAVKAEKPVDSTPAPEQPSEKPHKTFDDVHAIALRVRDEINIGALRVILARFSGAKKVSELQDYDYDLFCEACEARLEEK